MSRTAALVIAFVLSPALTLAGQDSDVLAHGNRIRIHAPTVSAQPLIGTIARHDSLTLWLQRGAAVDSIPLRDIRGLERSAGVDEVPVAQGLGAAIYLGGLAGATYAASQSKGCDSTLEHVACGVAGFLLGGFALGEFFENLWPRRSEEKWVAEGMPRVSIRLLPSAFFIIIATH